MFGYKEIESFLARVLFYELTIPRAKFANQKQEPLLAFIYLQLILNPNGILRFILQRGTTCDKNM